MDDEGTIKATGDDLKDYYEDGYRDGRASAKAEHEELLRECREVMGAATPFIGWAGSYPEQTHGLERAIAKIDERLGE